MNNDLISRSALVQSLRNNVLVDVTPKLEQAIAEQPAAYNVDKVVERLEEMRDISIRNIAVNSQENDIDEEISREISHYQRIIRTVKSGSIEIGGNMRYKCIKEMCLPKCDGDGFEIPNEYGFVTVGSIWERDDRRNLIGGDVHMDSLDDGSDLGWMETSFENLEENFVLIG